MISCTCIISAMTNINIWESIALPWTYSLSFNNISNCLQNFFMEVSQVPQA